jgi:hypothetical protein
MPGHGERVPGAPPVYRGLSRHRKRDFWIWTQAQFTSFALDNDAQNPRTRTGRNLQAKAGNAADCMPALYFQRGDCFRSQFFGFFWH